MPILLTLVGIFFIFKLKFFYILHPIKTFKSMMKGGFKSLSLALAGTLGIGNIVGVASAILSGGPGAIFWMWISAFLAMGIKYVEVMLAMKHRQKSKNGQFYGGAPYYISEGFKGAFGKKISKFIGCIFAFLCVLNSLTTGNLVQINSVVSISKISPLYFGLIISFLIFIIILGGYKRISIFTSFLIPLLSIFYIAISIYIIFSNLGQISSVFNLIFKNAFSVKSATSGFMGFGIMSAIRFGVSRGILSNEAGCGTSPTAHASSNANDIHSQACLGIFEVFVDTILLCSLTGIVILLSNIDSSNPMTLVVSSFALHTGIFGRYGIIVSAMLFSFATIACQYYYGFESLRFMSKRKFTGQIYTFIFCLTIVIGAIIPMTLMWQISDLLIAIMTVFNLICLLYLYKK